MKSLIRSALIASVGVVVLTLPALALGSARLADGLLLKSGTARFAAAECFTDDGYGRKRSCSAGRFKRSYKKKAPVK